MILYKITHKISGKCYIGQTVSDLNTRWSQHCSKGNILFSAIKKYGRVAFTIEEINSYKTLEDLNNAEEYYISWFNSIAPNGYNLRKGGNSGGSLHEKTKTKLSIAHTGKKRSGAHKKSMSECRMGHNVTEETRNKISNSRKGIVFSKQQIINMSKPRSEEHKKAISIGKKGKSHPHKGNRRKKKLQIFDAIVKILNSTKVQ